MITKVIMPNSRRAMDRVMVNFVLRAILLFLKFVIDAFFMEDIVQWIQRNVFMDDPEEPEGGHGQGEGQGRV